MMEVVVFFCPLNLHGYLSVLVLLLIRIMEDGHGLNLPHERAVSTRPPPDMHEVCGPVGVMMRTSEAGGPSTWWGHPLQDLMIYP